MQVRKSMFILVCLAAVPMTVLAQGTTTRPAAATIEPAIQYVPAGALGFAVVHNIKNTTANAERFLTGIGLQQFVETMPGGVLGMIQSAAQLSEGFNPNGSFLAVMLDPQQYGVDLGAAMGMPGADDTPAKEQKLPFVLLVPGSSVKDLFSNYQMKESNKYTVVSLRMGDVFATKIGGYVAFSPLAKALDAVTASSGGEGLKEMPKEPADMLSRSDIAIHLNMKVAGPIIINMLKQAKQKMAAEKSNDLSSSQVQMAMDQYADMVSQLQNLTLMARFAKTGLAMDGFVSFQPDSMYGKAIASIKSGAGKLLDRLPNINYVLAAGAGGRSVQLDAATQAKLAAMYLQYPVLKSMSPQDFARAQKLCMDLQEQITEYQFVLGGAPENSGPFGAALVLQCKDAAKTRGLLADAADLAQKALLGAVGDAAGAGMADHLKDLKIAYQKEAATVDALKADAITITAPAMDEKKDEIKKVLGDEQIRILVASPDNKTVVMTFGGSTAMMTEALKTAGGSGTILADKNTAEPLSFMPANRISVGLLNIGNLFGLVNRISEATGESPTPVSLTTQTPVAFGASVSGSSEHVVIYVPNDLIKEGVNLFQMMMGGGGPGRGGRAPVRGGEGF